MTTSSPESLQIGIAADGTVRIAGELDAATAPDLQAVLAKTLAVRPNRLVLDVTDVGFCDSSGLTTLVWARNHLPKPSQLVLRGASNQLRGLLRITHLDTVITLAEQ